MSTQIRSLIIVILVVAAVGAVAYMKSSRNVMSPDPTASASQSPAPATREAAAACTMPKVASRPITTTSSVPATAATRPAKLPRLVDLGATKCIPCKMMAPILEELRKEYAGHLDVIFIDVWENREAVGQYGISTIPTQIFYDVTGKERFRHEGYFAKADILAKWKELGVSLTKAN
jgi:thioredoxin 1